MTGKLYWEEPEATRFRARVTASGRRDRGCWVELDRTLFYPAAGGQPDDRGVLEGAPVLRVELVGGRIRHHLDAPEPPAGEVEGTIDRARRWDARQQHTGQHLLSAACLHLLGLPTVSARLGSEVCTLDLDLDRSLSPEEIRCIEAWLDDALAADIPVETTIHPPEEVPPDLRGRKEPGELGGVIRVVTIGALDRSLCGGTHLARTGQVGLVVITGQERAHRRLRLEFLCGQRAARRLRRDLRLLERTAGRLSCGLPEVPEVLEGLQGELKEVKKHLKVGRKALMDMRVQRIVAEIEPDPTGRALHVETWDGTDPGEARSFLQALLTREPRILVALACPPGTLILGRGDGTPLDLRPLLAKLLRGSGGRGGGSPSLVQAGGIPTERLQEILREAARALRRGTAPNPGDS